MLMNLSEVFLSENLVREYFIKNEEISIQAESLHMVATLAKPLHMVIRHQSKGKVQVEVQGVIRLVSSCDRCLKEVTTELVIAFEQMVYSPDHTEECREFMEGYSLQVDALVTDQVIMSWPMKVLCSDDCKGICPICGQDRNVYECGCDVFIPDPRMAAIKDIFNANKEV